MTESGPVLNRGSSYKSPPQGTFLIGRMITDCTDLGPSSLCPLLLLLLSHSDSLQPHGLQPTRLLCPWHFPDKNTGVGCRFLLQSKCYQHPYFTDVETEAERRVTCPRSHSQERLDQGLSSQGGPGSLQGSGLLGLCPICLLPRRRVRAEGEPGAESSPDNVPALGHRHPLWGTWNPPCAQTTARFLLIAAGGLWAQSGLHHAWGQRRAR